MEKIISIGLIAAAGITASSISFSGGIPQSFPVHTTAINNMPPQAINRKPSFPPSRAMSGQGGTQMLRFPSMPSQSIQGTSQIPVGPGLEGFKSRGSRRPWAVTKNHKTGTPLRRGFLYPVSSGQLLP
jgi:hypothetical protein